MIVLDTNVLSALTGEQPDGIVGLWLNGQNRESVYTTAVTEAELFYGISLLAHGHRQTSLRRRIELTFNILLAGRVLAFDRGAAVVYGAWAAERRRIGRPVGVPDLQIAAIARSRGADAIATRNVRDFEGCGVALIDPWQAA